VNISQPKLRSEKFGDDNDDDDDDDDNKQCVCLFYLKGQPVIFYAP